MFIDWGLRLLPAGAAFSAFLLVRILCVSYHPERRLLRACQELTGMLREKQSGSVWYQRREEWLSKNGGVFHYGKWINPMRLLALQMGMAGLTFAVLTAVSWELGAIGGTISFFLPSGILMHLNRQDNRRLLPEIKLVYHAMELQIKAGVYVTDALAECYGSVQEKRLRSALLDLAGDIVMRADIYDAINAFQRKFDNPYVDSLCMIVLQALESGQAVELLGDIGEQIKDMEETELQRKKAALDRSITFYQLGIFAVVLGIALYACVKYMFGAAIQF